ncbi:alpha/beta hydrolase [Goodfellowiella coeruleoviolacea]|uniref:TAP-like protein n=1 Tax=Goodfellowiella coeruleoviolacea TaxID=334858 RepID=A0AAE3KFG3_9PSEU|nr:alpha/beta hydrolase [Goodfellowiella coeruleoviolacea]MCP2164389.1 TAP-like protein [Goodfellowiella coeruleoviolacea]
MRARTRALVAGLVAAVGGTVAVAHPALAAAEPAAAPAGGFPRQHLAWHACEDALFPTPRPAGAERLDCAEFTAPRDWRHPGDGNHVTIAVSRLRPPGAAPRGVLFTNPGGPGLPGRAMPLELLAQPRVSDAFEVIGVDVRGTGASDNVTCGPGGGGAVLDPRDRSRANIDALLARAERTAHACQQASGELGRFVTTEQTVHDLDLLRALLGQDRISYYGMSGGTWLGAFYATYFPRRVDTMVLDSTVDFTGTLQDSDALMPMGFERRFREDFLPWVAEHDSVYHLGTSAEQVRQRYEALRAALAAAPVNGLSGAGLDNLVIGHLYKKVAFPALASRLVQTEGWVNGSAATAAQPPSATAAAQPPSAAAGSTSRAPDAAEAAGITLFCNDTPFRGDRDRIIAFSADQGARYPLRGWQTIDQPCAFWDRPEVHLPTPTGAGVPPVLMVQSTHDPATPYEGALRAHRAFAHSRLLTVTGEGDHGVYNAGNACVDTAVADYLVNHAVPGQDLTCAGLPIPEPVTG